MEELARGHINTVVAKQGYFDLEGVNIVGNGADQTRSPLLGCYAQPLLDARTPDELAAACVRVKNAFDFLGVYDSQIATTGPPLLAHVSLVAQKRFTIATGTNVGNQEGYGYIKGTTRNVLGLGETVNMDLHMGTRTTKSNLLTLSAPAALLRMPIEWKLEVLGYDSNKHADWGLHKEEVRGATVRMASALHSFGIDAVLRTMYSENSGTLQSPTFCQQAGYAFKLSAFFNMASDTRDNLFLPTRGRLLRMSTELAAGDHPCAKLVVDAQQGWKFGRWSASATGRFGYLQPLILEWADGARGLGSNTAATGTTHLMDRFYMGGSTDVRGFAMNCAGPHEGKVSVGGNAVATAGLSLFSPVPRASENLHGHLFLNAGSLGDAGDLLKPRVSAGLGLVFNHPMSRFELNVAMPLVAHSGDRMSKGLQLGIGMQYL